MPFGDRIRLIENQLYNGNHNVIFQYNHGNIKNSNSELTAKDSSNSINSTKLLDSPSSRKQLNTELSAFTDNNEIFTKNQLMNNHNCSNNNGVFGFRSDAINSAKHLDDKRKVCIKDEVTEEKFSGDGKTISNKKCKVCSDKAVNQNFGVLSCESCKAFFRRNAIRSSPLKCSNGTDLCNVTSVTRKQCPACRLKKCLFVGMRSELIQIRKNNPKLNSHKRKTTSEPHDHYQQSWSNQNQIISTSRNLYPQNYSTDSCSKKADMVSPIASNDVWVNASRPNGVINQLVSTNSQSNVNIEFVTNNYLNPINVPIGTSPTQIVDPFKCDFEIPLIKIKTNSNIIHPVAILPTIQTTLYSIDTNVHKMYLRSSAFKSIRQQQSCDPVLTNSDPMSFSKIYFQPLNQTSDLPSYPVDSAFTPIVPHSVDYSFHPPQNVNKTSEEKLMTIKTEPDSNYKNIYQWQESGMNSSDSSGRGSFVSIDSNCDLQPDVKPYHDLLSTNSESSNLDEDDNKNFDYILHEDINRLLESETEDSYSDVKSLYVLDQEFSLRIGNIWRSTINSSVPYPNPNDVKVSLNLTISSDIFSQTKEQFSWAIDFINLSEIFLRQIRSFLRQMLLVIDWKNEFIDTLEAEIFDQLENQSNTALLIIIPVLFSNMMSNREDNKANQRNVDSETMETSISNLINSSAPVDKSKPNTLAKFLSITTKIADIADSVSVRNSEIDLLALSANLYRINSIRYSALQYLAEYCCGLFNFLSCNPVFYGLFVILKLIVFRSNVDYCDQIWNVALLHHEYPPMNINDKIGKLIYYLKNLFVMACEMSEVETVEQRLNSLNQFLLWGRAQFDLQWIDFFKDTISDCLKEQQNVTTVQTKLSDYILKQFGFVF